jgi:hypothetical protein
MEQSFDRHEEKMVRNEQEICYSGGVDKAAERQHFT